MSLELTQAQKDELEGVFNITKYPEISRTAALASVTGLTRIQIRTWFAHRRHDARRLQDSVKQLIKKDEKQSVIFTAEQLQDLQKAFDITHYPDTRRIGALAYVTGLTKQQIESWFAERREACRNNQSQQLVQEVKDEKPTKEEIPELTQNQKIHLQNAFNITHYPRTSRMAALVHFTGLTKQQIQSWFSDRRELWRTVHSQSPFPIKAVDEKLELTQTQKDDMEGVFKITHNPDIFRREALARITGLTDRQILSWFTDRREVLRTSQQTVQDQMQMKLMNVWTEEMEKSLNSFKAAPKLTRAQIDKLEAEYDITKYPDVFRREKLATVIGSTEQQVNSWFVARRNAWRDAKRSAQEAKSAKPISVKATSPQGSPPVPTQAPPTDPSCPDKATEVRDEISQLVQNLDSENAQLKKQLKDEQDARKAVEAELEMARREIEILKNGNVSKEESEFEMVDRESTVDDDDVQGVEDSVGDSDEEFEKLEEDEEW